ncbi:hypothetical protein K431DRAFT_287492 [Polychaeton citri CBS 116435]|uniref:Uncharacterized protein n=1 Tax=Polychaeton citri CBS 116435 TaxID=1314669 RepID=A0A9P4Q5N4_9PEZI|nr:hypothetical protein K431DRAFT_287492 [Polychaeton citri CBS 116435]
MRASRTLWQHRQPLIKFLGRRTTPTKVDHTPHAHPASPSNELPESFAQYRNRVQSHGPLGGQRSASSAAAPAAASNVTGRIGGQSGRSLGPVEPKQGQFWDRNELPQRFRRTPWSLAEIEAVESGGATAIMP